MHIQDNIILNGNAVGVNREIAGSAVAAELGAGAVSDVDVSPRGSDRYGIVCYLETCPLAFAAGTGSQAVKRVPKRIADCATPS
jgi:hypothetical protein